jgi:hypothetical protein
VGAGWRQGGGQGQVVSQGTSGGGGVGTDTHSMYLTITQKQMQKHHMYTGSFLPHTYIHPPTHLQVGLCHVLAQVGHAQAVLIPPLPPAVVHGLAAPGAPVAHAGRHVAAGLGRGGERCSRLGACGGCGWHE